MDSQTQNRIIEQIVGEIEIPDSAYELAEKRYKDLGDWFSSPNAKCHDFKPYIYPQGSFRFGTVIRPLDDKASYDLDLSCKLQTGVSRAVHTQEQLKTLVGLDVESYRVARGIEEEKEEKRRCWRLEYADDMSFHMDIVPCVPEEEAKREIIRKAMLNEGVEEVLAKDVASFTVSITDNEHPGYRIVTPDWNVSNPEGYARWFVARMEIARELREARLIKAHEAKVDDLPVYQWKTPLQRCVQILKRHRDIMFRKNPDGQPISIIITTLSARAYQGEVNIGDALQQILSDMEGFVNASEPYVPNPVNPDEDFADKWDTPEGRAKRLKDNFRSWVQQAQADFEGIATSGDADVIVERALKRYGASLKANEVRKALGVVTGTVSVSPKSHKIETPAKPWRP